MKEQDGEAVLTTGIGQSGINSSLEIVMLMPSREWCANCKLDLVMATEGFAAWLYQWGNMKILLNDLKTV
jgi:hypothetical protein